MTTLQRILHVDDEADIREIVKLTLEALGGFTVETCQSGQHAIDMVPAFKPDLILLDVMMPGMDGPATLKELRQLPETNQTPTIFMTAKVQAHETVKYLEMGGKGVIAKPFDPLTICDQIKDIWGSQNA